MFHLERAGGQCFTNISCYFITSLAKEVMFLVALVCLFVCLSVNNITQLEALRERRPPWPRQIITLILPTVKLLSLGCERLPTLLKKKKKRKKTPRLNIFTVGHMRVMICLSQGGLRSLSASSFIFFIFLFFFPCNRGFPNITKLEKVKVLPVLFYFMIPRLCLDIKFPVIYIYHLLTSIYQCIVQFLT